MRLVAASLAVAIGSLFIAARASALEVCINGPSSYGGSIDAAAVDAVIALQPRCVRVMYRQDNAATWDDPAVLARFDALVAKYEAAGVEPYMLIHTESFNMDPHAVNTDATRATFVADATKLIDHYKPHVRRFEIINEPNNWDASMMPTVSAPSFAATLSDLYTSTKIAHANDACWDVDLVSGALFAFHRADGTGTSASDYLGETYAAAAPFKQANGKYPFDDIGWHLYMEETDAASTAAQISTYTGQLWSAVTQHEGSSNKTIWISEFGFGTNDSQPENDAQAQSLDSVFDALANDAHVAMGMWFTFQDFDSSGWGLYRAGGFDDAHARPSRDRFVAQAKSKPEARWAKLAFESPTTTVAAGARATLKVTATNLGADSWSRDASVRLGAGPGCPITPIANAALWAPADGYANTADDARVFLASTDSITTGASVTFTFDVVAPQTAGTYALSARMVREGVAWFGSPASATLIVTSGADAGVDSGSAADSGANADSGAGAGPEAGSGADTDAGPGNGATPGASTGCGCLVASARASGVAPLALLALIALVATGRRSRR